jgi:hypothetical protein
MQSICSFIELADMHLALGVYNRCCYNMQRSFLIGECHIVRISFLLTHGSERREHLTEFDGMLVVHVVYTLYGWKIRTPRSLKGRQPSILDVLQLVQVPPMLTRTAVASISHSVCAKFSVTRCTCRT